MVASRLREILNTAVPRGARVQVCTLLCALMVAVISNYYLVYSSRWDAAELRMYRESSFSNELIVRAYVEPTAEGGLNSFVLERFGSRTMCSWTLQFVYCGYGNTTQVYDLNAEARTGGGRGLLAEEASSGHALRG